MARCHQGSTVTQQLFLSPMMVILALSGNWSSLLGTYTSPRSRVAWLPDDCSNTLERG